MDWQTFLHLFQKGENNSTKFFRSETLTDQICMTTVAMANTNGGDIFIGFDCANYHLLGTTKGDAWWRSFINEHCSEGIDIEFEKLQRNDKTILRFRVLEGILKPYYFKTKCYVMSGDKPVLALFEEEKIMQGQSKNLVGSYQSTQIVDAEPVPPISEDIVEQSYDEPDPIQAVQDTVYDEYRVHDQVLQSTYVIKNKNETSDLDSQGSVKVITPEAASFDQSQRVNYKSLLRDQGLNKRQVKVINFLQVNESIKNKEYREIFGVSHKTAHIELSDLLTRSFLAVEGAGRSTCYRLSLDFHAKVLEASEVKKAEQLTSC